MKDSEATGIQDIILRDEALILKEWMKQQLASVSRRQDLISESELSEQSRNFLRAFVAAIGSGQAQDINGPEWTTARDLLSEISKSRSRQGFTPSETATFVFSLKQPVFTRLQQVLASRPSVMATELLAISELLDRLGLFTTNVALKAREEIILRQQQEMLELSTPVVKLWEGILALPLI